MARKKLKAIAVIAMVSICAESGAAVLSTSPPPASAAETDLKREEIVREIARRVRAAAGAASGSCEDVACTTACENVLKAAAGKLESFPSIAVPEPLLRVTPVPSPGDQAGFLNEHKWKSASLAIDSSLRKARARKVQEEATSCMQTARAANCTALNLVTSMNAIAAACEEIAREAKAVAEESERVETALRSHAEKDLGNQKKLGPITSDSPSGPGATGGPGGGPDSAAPSTADDSKERSPLNDRLPLIPAGMSPPSGGSPSENSAGLTPSPPSSASSLSPHSLRLDPPEGTPHSPLPPEEQNSNKTFESSFASKLEDTGITKEKEKVHAEPATNGSRALASLGFSPAEGDKPSIRAASTPAKGSAPGIGGSLPSSTQAGGEQQTDPPSRAPASFGGDSGNDARMGGGLPLGDPKFAIAGPVKADQPLPWDTGETIVQEQQALQLDAQAKAGAESEENIFQRVTERYRTLQLSGHFYSGKMIAN